MFVSIKDTRQYFMWMVGNFLIKISCLSVLFQLLLFGPFIFLSVNNSFVLSNSVCPVFASCLLSDFLIKTSSLFIQLAVLLSDFIFAVHIFHIIIAFILMVSFSSVSVLGVGLFILLPLVFVLQ